MTLLMLSTDRQIFTPGSAVAARQVDYAKKFETIHIIVMTGPGFLPITLSPNCFAYPTNSWTKWRYARDTAALGRKIINREGVTNITCQDPFLTARAGVWLKKKFNLPLEIQVHTDIGSPNFATTLGKWIRLRLAERYLPEADHIRVVSQRIKDYLINSLNLDPNKIEVRPIVVDKEKIKLSPVTIDLHQKYPQFSKIVLMASRLTKEKNLPLATGAMALLATTQPEIGLVIVGSGPEKIPPTSNVLVEPWVDQATLYSYYHTADLFLLTSLYEGYGLTLVEAAAANCPTVSTDVGVAREAGATIVPYDPGQVAEAIVESLNKS